MLNNRLNTTILLIFLIFFSVLGTAFAENNPNASIKASFNPSNVKIGDNVTLIIAIANNGPNDYSNVSVMAKLPQGLKYISHSTGLDKNNYDPNTGIWDVGNMNFGKKGAQKTLNITAQVTSPLSGPVDVKFNQIFYSNNGQVVKADVLPATTVSLNVQDSGNTVNNTSVNPNNSQNNNMGTIYLIIAVIIIIAIALIVYFKFKG